jgi:hypothetical protein
MSLGVNYSDGKEWLGALDDKKVGMARQSVLAFLPSNQHKGRLFRSVRHRDIHISIEALNRDVEVAKGGE